MFERTGLPLPNGDAIDRRVVRTRTALYDALVALVRRKPYDAIGIDDILAEADVGRSTFYAHFTSKDDLLARSLERVRAVLTDVDGSMGITPALSRAYFEHVAAFSDVHDALSGGKGSRILHDAMVAELERLVSERLHGSSGLPQDLAVRHIVATFMTVTHWWLDRKPKLSPAEVDTVFRALIGPVGAAEAVPTAPASPSTAR